MQRFRVHLDVPEAYQALARFGIKMLLLPWRLDVTWKGEMSGADPDAWPKDIRTDLYYGTDERKAEAARIGVVLDAKPQPGLRAGRPNFHLTDL